MKKQVFSILTVRADRVRLSRHQLEALRMLMDWQLRARGLEPVSVNAAFQEMDDD